MVTVDIGTNNPSSSNGGGGSGSSSSNISKLTSRIRRLSSTTNANANANANVAEMHFSWDSHVQRPKLILTSNTPDFDPVTVSRWRAEGFTVAYLPCDVNDAKEYRNNLLNLADELELGDKYAIVAYHGAAALCLEACLEPMPKLCALIVYYPSFYPAVTIDFPSSLLVQIHMAGSQGLGIHPNSFSYPDTVPGFAEHDLEVFDKVSFGLAWSRALGVMRKGFGIEVDLERIWDHHTDLEFVEKDADATMKTMVKEPYVNHVPTMTGGIGYHDLRRFYADFFIPGNPPDMRIKLLSRTVGTDRVVDEMLCSFTHTTEVPWMLPGVPPTDRKVSVVLVGVICIRGGLLYHEHIHWDQATVLVQIGLLDPKLVPSTFKAAEAGREKDVKRLPVVGAEGAMKVMDEKKGESNDLISGW